MLEDLKTFYDTLTEIRKYLIKKGKSRYTCKTTELKLNEARLILHKSEELFSCFEKSKDLSGFPLETEIFENIFKLFDEISNLCSSPKTFKTMEFNLKEACNLIPIMDDTETTTKRMIDSIEMYASMIDEKSNLLLIKFVLLSRLSENAKLRISGPYTSIGSLIKDLKQHLLTKKSYTAIQARLQSSKQGQRSIEEFGKDIEQLFTDMTISQADGDSSVFSVLKPINEKSAIKHFSDGLRSSRLSTIVTSRNYSSLKDAIQAAKDEDRPHAEMNAGNIMHASKQGRTFNYNSYRRGRGYQYQRGNFHNNYGQYNANYYRGQVARYTRPGNFNNFRGRYNYGRSSSSQGYQRGRERYILNNKNSRSHHSHSVNRNVYAAEQTNDETTNNQTNGPIQFFRS